MDYCSELLIASSAAHPGSAFGKRWSTAHTATNFNKYSDNVTMTDTFSHF